MSKQPWASKADGSTTQMGAPASAWLAGIVIGVALVAGSIWIPQTDLKDGEESWFWFKRTVEQVAANLVVDGWPMIAASLGALALVVTIVAFVGSSQWTVTSDTKRQTLADAAWSLTLLASAIATVVSSSVVLVAVPLVRWARSAVDVGSDGHALQLARDALGGQARLLLLGMVGLGVLLCCRYADRALRAWIRVDQDDAVQHRNTLSERMRVREELRATALRRRGAEWESTRRVKVVATMSTAGVALALSLAGSIINVGVRMVAGRPFDFFGLTAGLSVFALVHTLIVGTAVFAWRKSQWTTSPDMQGALKPWQRTWARRWTVFAAASVVPALVLIGLINLDGSWSWVRGTAMAVVIAVFGGILWVLAGYRGRYSWDDVAARVAIAELTSGVDADRARIVELESGAGKSHPDR